MSNKSLAEILAEIDKKMVPDSANKGKDIDNQWLEPASHDKKMVDAMTGSPEMYDQEDHEAENFKAQDTVKKNTKAPAKVSESMEASPKDSVSSSDWVVNALYERESLDLLDEILGLVEDIEDDDPSYCWREIASNLKTVRDILVRDNLRESAEITLEEDFKPGKYKLKDGQSIKISKGDAKLLNFAISTTSNKNKMVAEISANKSEFNEFLQFARNLNEDYLGVVNEALEEMSIEQLEQIAEDDGSNLVEGRIWDHTKVGARLGTTAGIAIGSKIGSIGGGLYGGTVGGTAGMAVGASKSATQLVKKIRQQRKNDRELDRYNKQVAKSILGTSAPSLDSDSN